ncbi:MAG: hypothetical protein ACYTFO_03675, partial [Planctomycetota bacterium]
MKRLAILTLAVVGAAFAGGCGGGKSESNAPAAESPEVVLAKGVELASTASPEQKSLIESLRQAAIGRGDIGGLTIDYPLTGSVFPPEMVAPTFLWHDGSAQADRWLIEVTLGDGSAHVYVLTEGPPAPAGEIDPRCLGPTNEVYEPTDYQASARSWTPDARLWQAIQDGSKQLAATVTVLGYSAARPDEVISRGQMVLSTSEDPISGMIFYRDVPLMPEKLEGGSVMPIAKAGVGLIAWRLRDISRHDSRVVLTDMPTCANCHSFSADGSVLAMDMDGPVGDKGAYAIAPIDREMVIEAKDVITWNSVQNRVEDSKTIGFLSQISPDGRYAVTTINESLYIANFLDYRFLQVFYPTRGILAYYSRETGEMAPLPGADDTDYVHCQPAWGPEGDYIVFARARALDPYSEGVRLPSYANDPDELPMQYDLYRMPFNGGRGGTPEPVVGASDNGMSNTFPKVSPDGKWIVFVQCRNGQLMRPDSRLWIVPAAGGEAREMACNTSLMNSWHSFSPNGRWMVFSSKSNTPYTQMFLTHIDDDGNDSAAILIPNATAANRAVNIPEFVNIGYDDLVSIQTPTVEYYRHYNLASDLRTAGRHEEAIAEYRRALEAEP